MRDAQGRHVTRAAGRHSCGVAVSRRDRDPPVGRNPRRGRAQRTRPVTVAQLLDSASLALPDPTTFQEYDYKSGLQAEYIARPSIGYAPDNFGRSVFGGTTIVFSDLLGNNRLAVSPQSTGA